MSVSLYSYIRFSAPTIARVIDHSPEVSKDFKTGSQHAALAALDACGYTEKMGGEVGFPDLAVFASLFSAINATQVMARSLAKMGRVSTEYADGFNMCADKITSLIVAWGEETESVEA